MVFAGDNVEFNLSDEWIQFVQESKTSEVVTPVSTQPIPEFSIGTQIENSYIAILIQTTQGKPTWRFGGELRQQWAFAAGADVSSQLALVASPRFGLGLNKLEIIPMLRPSIEPYQLIFKPPPWFKDVIVIAWRYTGEVENFVKDTLFDIGNQLGIGTGIQQDNLSNKIDLLNEVLNISVTSIQESIEGLQQFQTGDFIEVLSAIERLNIDSNIITQLNQLDAGIFTLFEALSNLIPASEATQLEQSLKTRLDLGEEFL